MSKDPIAVSACVFDAYGTHLRLRLRGGALPDVLGDKAAAVTTLWRDKQLQYTWLRSLQGRHADFWQVTGDALDFTLETLGLPMPALRDRLMGLYRTLDCFPEVPDVLRRLKEAGFVTAILSNGSPADARRRRGGAPSSMASLDQCCRSRRSACSRPHPRVYQLAVDRLGVPRRRHLLPVLQCLGRARGLGLRHARGVVQPLRPAPRAAAGRPGPRGPLAGRAARPARPRVSRPRCHSRERGARQRETSSMFDHSVCGWIPALRFAWRA